jgi:cytochrome c oxidase cbb3-type subunit 3
MGLCAKVAVVTFALAAGVGCSKAQAEEPPDGALLFASTCSRCHGAKGTGGPPLGDGQPAPRNLTDPAFQASKTDEELVATVKNGKNGVMPSFKDVYSDAQIRALVRHVRTLKGK